jgi:hypothetical protein
MERIVPSHDGPGAAEAHAIGYVDWAGGEPRFQATLARLSAGADLLDSLATGLCGRPFAACAADERDAVLTRLQTIPHPLAQRFFPLLVRTTLAGFLCPPSQGGNRDGVGWEYIGFDPGPRWAPRTLAER